MGVPISCAYCFGEGAISAIRDRIRAREYGGQDPEAQIRAVQRHGCERVFRDKASGRLEARAQLDASLEFLPPGDSLVVWRFDRLGRSVRHMLYLTARLERQGCQLVSLTEAIYTGTPGGRLVFVMFAALAELEADLARERTRLAARLARERGELWGRRSPFHDPAHVRSVQAMLRDKRLLRTEIAKTLGIDVSTLYKWFPGGKPDACPGIHTGVPV